jgi:hypothetical protein
MASNHHLDRRAEKLLLEAINNDQLLTTEECAGWLGVSENWLAVGRIRGWGPPYQKPAPKILRYHPPAVRNWLKERARIASSHHDRKIAAKASREVLRKRDDTSRSAPRIPLHRKNRAGGC